MTKIGIDIEKAEAEGKEALEKSGPKAKAKAKDEELTPEEAQARAEEIQAKRARFAQVLSRGLVNEALRRPIEALPDDRVGLWVRERRDDIVRMEALGARVETLVDVDGLHGTGDGKQRVADCILMSIDKEDHELIKEIRVEQKRKRYVRSKKDFLDKARSIGMQVFDESIHHKEGG